MWSHKLETKKSTRAGPPARLIRLPVDILGGPKEDAFAANPWTVPARLLLMTKIEDLLKSTSREVEIFQEDIALFKNLIKERKHPLDLVREMLSNSGAKEVGATRIEIGYTKDREGHIFEIFDNGCGMNFTGNKQVPGRLDRFLGLGLSGIVGHAADEFSWKGLGSKLAYQSRRIEIETRFKDQPFYVVRINEPWSSLERNLIPKPRINEHPNPEDANHTRIKVFGHPPHRLEEPFTIDELKTFLLHRTFAGYTREREGPPEIALTVMGTAVPLGFGFPEFRGIQWPEGVRLDKERQTLYVNILPRSSKAMRIRLKGFLTWDAESFALSRENLNAGLIFSSRGFPYFSLKMEDYGARGIAHANPGEGKTCLVLECDELHSEMNISRSDLVDSASTLTFKKEVKSLFEALETAPEYLEFRLLPKHAKRDARGASLAEDKMKIESEDQNWVLLHRPPQKPCVLIREPKNETEVVALLWKLEALGALPFEKFSTLPYPGAGGGPDLFVNFQEDRSSEPTRCAVVEVENNFYSYKPHGHHPPQYPKVICWDMPTSGRKMRPNKTSKKWKFTINLDEYQVHVYVLKLMDGISIVSHRELRQMGIDI